MQTTNHCLLRAAAVVLTAVLAPGLVAQTAPRPTSPVPVSEEVVHMDAFEVFEMKAFSDQAIEGKTPVSFSEIGKEIIAEELGSRDIPLVLNHTPSVYATADSGGAGDARVNVRGFNQRNVSILINAVPTNDIENGWLYWSNWDGLGEVTSTIQVQRGLSNVTLPTPSIGGTMNIITDPATSKPGGAFKTEIGNDGFLKGTVVYNTGLLREKFALTLGLVGKKGDGWVRGAWTEGLGYYVGSTWKVNDNHRLELFAIGAPQQHGQRTFASNIAAYDAGYARSLGYSDADLSGALSRGPVDAGHTFNPNYAPVTVPYNGRQYYWGGTHSRQEGGFINERTNYFHKPQVNLNWYATLNDRTKLNTVLYYSGGRGGGSGRLNNTEPFYGFNSSSRAFGFISNSDRVYGSAIDWDRTILANQGTSTVRGDRTKPAGQSAAILRNSVNEQDQYGIVSKLSYEYSDATTLTAGLDWRTAEIRHFREVRDLLGGNFYLPAAEQASDFWADGTNTRLTLGDKVDYNNTNTVDWLGLFVQSQYDSGPITGFAVYGYSIVDYSYVDHFRRASNGRAYELDPGSIDGHQIKGGLQYAFSDNLRGFVNAGWVSKTPIFDGAINDVNGVLVEPINEKFKSAEAGVRFETSDRRFNVSASYYYTVWNDRTVSSINSEADTITYQRGIKSNYAGLEIEGAWQPGKLWRFDFAGSVGNWYYTDDVRAETFQISTGAQIPTTSQLYIAGLKVGDAPQTQLAYALSVFPKRGLSVKLQGRWYDRYWADFTPESRTDPTDRAQSWEIPSYQVYDLHVNYRLPLELERFEVSVFVHVFNLFDEVYVSDATDESSFEAISGAPAHSPQRAEAFLGPPVTYNLGVKVKF